MDSTGSFDWLVWAGSRNSMASTGLDTGSKP